MTHKRIQLNYPGGKGVEIQFNLEYNGTEIEVTTIQVHANFEIDIPHSPTLEWYNEKIVLGHHYMTTRNGQQIEVVEYLESEIAKDIVEVILQAKEAETPRFES